MHTVLYFVALALCWSGSTADKCYACTQVVHKGDQTIPNSCAEGKFDRDHLPRGVAIKDCYSAGCSKSVAGVEAYGYKTVVRDCAVAMLGNTCVDASTSKDNIVQSCTCQGDFCNGAAGLNGRQALFGLLASIIALTVM